MHRLTLLALFILLIVLPSQAAPTDFTLARSITMSQGLPSNTVRHIAQDPNGFIWFGTDNGLCRYDGITIDRLVLPTSDNSQYVTSLLPMADVLLIGTHEGVYYYEYHSGQFQQLVLKAQDGQVINTEVTSLARATDETVWLSTTRQGIFCYQLSDKQLLHCNVANSEVRKVYVDDAAQVWALAYGSQTPLMWLDRSKGEFVPMALNGGNELYALSMLQTHDGRYWLGTWTQGLMQLSLPSAQSLTSSTMLSAVSTAASIKHIHTLFELSPDCLLIGSDDGLIAYNPQTSQVTHFPQVGASQTMPRFIYDIMTDSEGGLWTSTFYSGIHYFSDVPNRFQSYTQQPEGGTGLAGSVINRFCQDRDGRVWVASDDGGLNLFMPSTGSFTTYPGHNELIGLNVHALAIDNDDLWIGTYSSGIYCLNTRTGALRHRSAIGYETSAYAILHTRSGQHWVGTMSDVSLLADFDAEPLLNRNLGALVIDIDEDSSGNIWFCTHGTGLWKYSPKLRKWSNYLPGQSAKKDDSQGQDINNLCITGAGRILVSSGDGIYEYDQSNDAFTLLSTPEKATDVMAIIEEQGTLWIATASHLLRCQPEGTMTRFGMGDGIRCGQYMPNAVMCAADGRLFFGTTHGFTCFYPRSIRANKNMPRVYITKAMIYDEDMASHSPGVSLPFAKKIHLSYDDDMLTLYFAALSYVAPSQNAYKYMLDGFDKRWNECVGEGKAVYTNLPPGKYTFRVKAANNDGIWSDTETTLTIVVAPPFFWNPIAWILYVLIAIALAFWLVRRMRTRQEQRHKQELHELEVTKQAEMRDIQLKFYTTIAHEIRTPVSLIIGPLEVLMDKLRSGAQTITQTTTQESLSVIHRNASRLLELVNQLLDYNKMQQGQTMQLDRCNLADLVRSVTDRFIPELQRQNVQLTVTLPDEPLFAVVDSEAIVKVVSNLMTNARKYTRTLVNVTLAPAVTTQPAAMLTIEDDGQGINQSDMKKIFTPFFQARNNKPGTGIGLSIVKNIIDMHHGQVDVSSREGHGTTFTVIIPLEQKVSLDSSKAEAAAVKTVEKEMPLSVSDTISVDNNPQLATGLNALETDEQNATPVILVVEDDYDMLRFIVDNLKADYTVITAENGIRALEQLRLHDVSLVISDWMMPEMDGEALCRRVRSDERTSHVPFIMLTARTDGDSKTEGMQSGADLYIEKPFSMKYLHACIRNVLDMRRLLFKKFSQNVKTKIEEVAKTPVDNEFLLNMQAIIEENISNADFNVAMLAQQMGVSRSSLFAKVKGITDATPNEMLQVVRLRKAAELLLEADMRVNEVCYKVGFNNPSYFTKCFQKQFGVTPTEYAKGETQSQ